MSIPVNKMSIQGKVNELNSIKNELTILSKRGKALRIKKKEIEKEINDYLEAKDQPGLKYQGTAIIRETKTVRKPKKKLDQKYDALDILEKYGISNAEEVLKELADSKRGSPEETSKLKIKSYKKNKDGMY